MKSRLLPAATLCLLGTLFAPRPAEAFPGFFIGKNDAARVSHSTQVVVMKKGDATVVSLMPDYDGPLEPFAVVLAVPEDVDATHISTLKREFIDFIDRNTAPRFHEYWEEDPCDQAPPEQEWERSLAASDSGFLGGFKADPTKKVAKELSLDVKAKRKEGEYSISVLDVPLKEWADKNGYKLPGGADELVAEYTKTGLKIAVAEVDPNRMELVGGGRAQLSPLQYWTQKPIERLPIRLGLLSAPADKQEFLVYFLHPESRFDVTNYKSQTPPTNVALDFSAKERVGEFYAALHDLMLAKAPETWLNEFAWSADGCGQPCPAGSPVTLAALLSLGGEVFEQSVPEEEKNPEPPEMTDQEKDTLKAELKDLKTPKEKKEKKADVKAERQLIATRKALVSRHKYVISRLHHRYDKQSLKEDPQFAPAAGAIEGGVEQPKGPKGDASTEVKPSKENRFQVRYNNFHAWKSQIECQQPERGRWGKRWRWIRILNKTWIAEDLARKDRKQIKPSEVVLNDVPSLGLTAVAPREEGAPAPSASAAAGAGAEKAAGACGCELPGAPRAAWSGLGGLLVLGLGLARWRRRG